MNCISINVMLNFEMGHSYSYKVLIFLESFQKHIKLHKYSKIEHNICSQNHRCSLDTCHLHIAIVKMKPQPHGTNILQQKIMINPDRPPTLSCMANGRAKDCAGPRCSNVRQQKRRLARCQDISNVVWGNNAFIADCMAV